ncbi:hypothetical protein GGX14DRAFT_665967 [Mycena pura]|uniref:BRCT domain-containing protein n=1 Tax=Mycena pura TaxID=153505 RepID=A0AAD6V3J2_9AGAR|nr:hypothetical protein GGX14DRAFT_665967 [Mycena pura]
MVFQGVKFHLPSCVPADREVYLANLLTKHHATRAESIHEATHIVSNSVTFEGWRDVRDVEVVTEIWVERSIAAKKMQAPSHYSANPSMLFSGVIACSADLRPSDEEVINVGITALGGQWRMGLTKDVTHLFATSKMSERYATGMNYRDQTHIKVLVPDWFDDTVSLGKSNLDTRPYEWPEPGVLNRRPQSPEKLKQLQRGSMSPQKKALYKTATWEPDLSKPRLKSKDVWGGRHILLSTTLELTGARRKIVEDGVRMAQGVIIEYASNGGDGTSEEEIALLSRCDIFVTRHRTGRAFFKAWRAGKTIGTLGWLLNVQLIGVFSSPMDQLLHFPYPAHKVQDFEKHHISVTNYTGETRDYLKKLISLMGGNFTPSFSTSNTVLVAAEISGSKTEKAAEWSIPVVNHTWLEDCFLRWKSLTPATPKYVSYPSGVEFFSIVGERGLGNEITEIIAAEAGAASEDEEEESRADRNTPAGSQNSEEETEVEGGLMPMPSLDLDAELEKDVSPTLKAKSRTVKPKSADSDAEMEDAGARPQRSPAGPSTFKSMSRLKSKSTARLPNSDVDTGDEDGARHARPRPSTPKSMSKSRVKPTFTARSEDSDTSVENAHAGPSRIQSPAKSTPAPNKRTGVSASSEPQFDPELPRGIVRVKSLPSPSKSTPKKGKGKVVPSEPSQDESDKEPEVRPARKYLVRRAGRRSPRKAESDVRLARSDEPPRELDSDSEFDLPSRLLESLKQKPLPRKATPTPPSSPLSAPPTSPQVKRIPTKGIEVLVSTVASLSARKPPPNRTYSVSAVSHHRASTSAATPLSAPPRSRTETASSSSPASSVAANLATAGVNGRSRRSAAAKATQRLHDEIMPDVINFQNEMRNQTRKIRRVSGRSEAETEIGDDEDEVPSTKRRKLENGKKARASPSFDDHATKPARKSEVAPRNGKPIKLLTTQVELSDEVLKALAKLGAKVTNKSTECTHLLVPGIVRTEKFLCALAGAPFILTKEWALDSAAANELLPETDYLLKDDSGSKKYKLRLADALSRAKILKGTLFKGRTFFMTPNAHMNPALIRNIIYANGGELITNHRPSLRMLEKQPNRHLISCPDDATLWRQIATVCPVYNTELVLMSALRQEIDWDDESYLVEGSN